MSEKSRRRLSSSKPRFLTRDLFDHRDTIFSQSLATLTLSSLPFVSSFILKGAGMSSSPDMAAMFVISMLVPGYTGIRLLNAGLRAVHSSSKDTDKDPDLQFRGYQLAYAGENVALGAEELRKGDNIYLLKLPVLQDLELKGVRRLIKALADRLKPPKIGSRQKKSREADPKLWLSVYDGIIAQAKIGLGSRRIDWLGIEIPPQAPPLIKAALKGHEFLTREQLMSGKDFSLTDPERQIAILHRTGLGEFTLVKQSVLQQACATLRDTRVNTLIQQLEVTGSVAEAKKVEESLKNYLRALIVRYVEEGSSSSLVRTPDSPLMRTRTAVTTQVYRRLDGQLMVQAVPTTGGLMSAPRRLSSILGLVDLPPERVVENPEGFNRAQVAYAAHEFITRTDSTKLLTRVPPTKPDIQALLQQHSKGVEITPLQAEVDFKGTTHKKIRILPKVARQAILMLGLAGAVHFGFKGLEWLSPPNLSSSQSTATRLLENGQSHFSSDQIDWWVTTTGELDPRGYYAVSTAHHLDKDDGWIDETDIAELVTYPTEPNAANPHFSLQTRLRVSRNDVPQVKIPIKPNTVVEAVKVSDSKNTNLAVTSSVLKDGTVSLTIPFTPNLQNSYADIMVSLTPSDKGQVHADEPLNKLDPEGLDKEANELLSVVAERYIRTGDYYQSVVDIIAEGHLYNNNPLNTSKVRRQTNPATFLNIVNHLQGCNCELCNIEAVFVSHFLSPLSPSLNLVMGYGVELDSPVPKSGLPLRVSDLHLYTMRGRVIYDATPKNLADDEPTRQYVERKKHIPSEQEWIRQRNELAQKAYIANLFEKTLDMAGKALFGTSLTIWSLYTIALVYELQENFAQKTLSPFMDAKVRDRFSRQELEAMKHFLDWVSWGGERPFSQVVYSGSDKETLLQDLLNGSNRQRLGQYLKHPVAREGDLELLKNQKRKVRALANYARGGVHRVYSLIDLYT